MDLYPPTRCECEAANIVESDPLNCQLLEGALRARRNRVVVVGSAVDSMRMLALLKDVRPDVAIISAQLRKGPLEGFHVLRELRSRKPETRAILLLPSRERGPVVDAFRCGAQGIVFRDEPLETLCKCVHAVHQGQVWANSEHLGYVLEALSQTKPLRLQDPRGWDLLSKRQCDVVRLVADGMTNREISRQLRLSEHTVRNYLFQIFDKLGVSSRVELVLYCLREKQNGSAVTAG
jgi:DNA-binding NarL/FixJ family response regulator